MIWLLHRSLLIEVQIRPLEEPYKQMTNRIGFSEVILEAAPANMRPTGGSTPDRVHKIRLLPSYSMNLQERLSQAWSIFIGYIMG